MSTEVCHYRLALRDKPVGSHVIATSFRGRTTLLEATMTLQGRLGASTVRQVSKTHRQQFFSFSYLEETSEGGSQRSYLVEFDINDGLVKASKGADSASIPYIRPYEDPLGLLHHLRHLPEDTTSLTVPMLGKDVIIERLNLVPLQTLYGEQDVVMYQLLPGKSYVYVDPNPPYPIVMLSQRIDGQLIDAVLTRRDERSDAVNLPTERGRRRRRANRSNRRRPRH
jgi:hypothetical protein